LTDLERFFRRIVTNLAATDTGRLHLPLPLADIPLSIVPYRSNRRALQVETSEEYEMVLLRLCAGEGGFVRTEPEKVRQKFEDEARSTNPDLEVIHRFENVLLTLRPERVDHVLHAPEETFDAPAPPPAPLPSADQPPEEPFEDDLLADDLVQAEEGGGSRCVYCGADLPGRPVNFCPHCGQSQVALVCPECHADVEPGWRHCVNCGLALGRR
jgi:Double zinc ribbon